MLIFRNKTAMVKHLLAIGNTAMKRAGEPGFVVSWRISACDGGACNGVERVFRKRSRLFEWEHAPAVRPPADALAGLS